MSLGKRADVFLRISREMLKSEDSDNLLIERLVDALDMGFCELKNHPNDSVYSTLRKESKGEIEWLLLGTRTVFVVQWLSRDKNRSN